jgi:PKD repeat protein
VLDAGATPSHTYTTDVGSPFAVTLTVTDDGLLSDSDVTMATIAANTAPTADPGGPYAGITGAPVAFDGTGSTDDGAIVTYDWNFGDGTVVLDAGATPSHAYTTDIGSPFTVTLTVTDDGALSNAVATTATIALNSLPTANPGGPYNGSTGAAIAFDGTLSSDSDGTIVSYAWDFGDTNSGTGATPSHTYATDGVYAVTLTVTDNSSGASAPVGTTATIAIANEAPVAEANGPYLASMVLDLGDGVATVVFDSTGSNDADGSIASYSWDFGDGSPADTNPNPTHVYAAASTYIATLTVTDNDGDTGTDTAVVSVVDNQAPTAVDDTAAVPNGNGNTAFVNLTSNDTDVDGTIDGTSIVITSGPSRGSAVVVTDGVDYTNAGGWTGTVTLTYTVEDNDGAVSNEATVTINIVR